MTKKGTNRTHSATKALNDEGARFTAYHWRGPWSAPS
jgi:hypothetical protein